MTRSASQADQYEKCPEQYRLRRVERVTPRPAAWSHQGSAFHSACEVFELSGRRLSVEEVTEAFSDEYARLVNLSLDQEPDTDRWMTAGPSGTSDIEARHSLGRDQTAGYVNWASEHGPTLWKSPKGLPGVELHLKAEIGGVEVQGYVDQLVTESDGSGRIRDLKTGSTKSKFQLQTYKLLAEKALGLAVNKGDWYLAKSGGLSRPVDLSKTTEDEIGARYAEMDKSVKKGDFPAKPGFNCRFCDVSHACKFRR
ncbi:RecB family exonuclease [Streptomyces sp. NPDC055036]